MECTKKVHKKVSIEADIKISPTSDIGDIRSCCVGEPVFEECGEPCTYMVNQMMCVRFPLTISAKAQAKPAGIVCDAMNNKYCRPRLKPAHNSVGNQSSMSIRQLLCIMMLWLFPRRPC